MVLLIIYPIFVFVYDAAEISEVVEITMVTTELLLIVPDIGNKIIHLIVPQAIANLEIVYGEVS